MILEKLTIERVHRIFNPARPLIGKVKFTSGETEIELPIDEAAAQRILAIAADGMIDAAAKVAALTRADVLEAINALPAPDADEAAIRG